MSYIGPYGYDFDSYPSINLTVSSPVQTFAEPLTVLEMVHFLALPSLAQDRDMLLQSLIRAARADAERLQNRELVRKTWDMTLDGWPGNRLRLGTPLVSVDLVQYRDSDGNLTVLTEDTDYIVDTAKSPGVLWAKGSWPSFSAWPSSSITIRFTTGYAADDLWWSGPGDMVKAGMRLRVADLFFERLPKMVQGMDAADWAMSKGANLSVR